LDNIKSKIRLYDFYLPEKNILIECDGDYWHSLPENVENDLFKDELAKKQNFKLIRFPEYIIKSDSFESDVFTKSILN
jgi:very-short-patch-repair endonuclease